ncbi:hypothetical protein EJ06DRAFT_518073 [Trichodelitschia bisporula]|uniref:BHLH domain-containing protein n=1 Tax=Trichodelitschia bisporula TaxID=703511 RepID=A0A6G1IAD4_9PEZI|nr:hypothetical protein EJ06DRAFT_518073 [Trichodelitschia bisporula]
MDSFNAPSGLPSPLQDSFLPPPYPLDDTKFDDPLFANPSLSFSDPLDEESNPADPLYPDARTTYPITAGYYFPQQPPFTTSYPVLLPTSTSTQQTPVPPTPLTATPCTRTPSLSSTGDTPDAPHPPTPTTAYPRPPRMDIYCAAGHKHTTDFTAPPEPPKRRRGRPRLVPLPADEGTKSPPKPSRRLPHNQVERKYREGLNSELDRLRKAVPTLMAGQPGSESVEGGPAKPSKATILASAIQYIKALEEERERLRRENECLMRERFA